MENMTIPNPMIIKTHAKTNPTVIGRLFDEENKMEEFSMSRTRNINNISIIYLIMKASYNVECSDCKKSVCTYLGYRTKNLFHIASLLYNHTDNFR